MGYLKHIDQYSKIGGVHLACEQISMCLELIQGKCRPKRLRTLGRLYCFIKTNYDPPPVISSTVCILYHQVEKSKFSEIN